MNHKLTEKKDIKTNKGYYELVFDPVEWKQIQKDVYNNSRKNLEIAGFRKGKVPEQKVKEILTDNVIIRNSINKALESANKFVEESKTYTKPLNSDVIIEVTEATINSLTVKFNFTLKPNVNIEPIKKIKVKLPKRPRIVENDLHMQITNWLKSKGTLKKISKKAIIGNVVNIDFKGMVKGVPFEGGTSKNFNLELGSKRFIPGFEEQLIDAKEGDTKKVKVKFPEKYQTADLAGKEATFEVKINTVNELIVPKLTDDYVKEQNFSPNIKTVGDFNMNFRNTLVQQANQSWNNQISNIIIEKIGNEIKIDIHDSIKTSEIKNTHTAFIEQANSLKITPEELAQRSGLTAANYTHELELIAINKVKLTLIFREWIAKNNLKADDNEIKKQISEYKKNNNITEKVNVNTFKFRYLNDLAWSQIRTCIIKNSTPDNKKIIK